MEILGSDSQVQTLIDAPSPTLLEGSNLIYRPFSTSTLIRELFEEDAPLMERIANKESSMNGYAYNPEWHEMSNGQKCQGSYGLFQIACVNYDGKYSDLYDTETNIKVAKKILERQGVEAWGVCNTKKVDCK